MRITKIVIENFKGFKGQFSLSLNPNVNILVGNNEAGKSTILEAIHLALTGMLSGRYLKNELSQYLFNHDIEKEYLDNLTNGQPVAPPHILIELYFEDDNSPEMATLRGNNNSSGHGVPGIFYKIEFCSDYQQQYNSLITQGNIKSIPIEYYTVSRKSFARDELTSRDIPIKSALIDSSNTRNINGSDLYISRIIRNNLNDEDKVSISQAHRLMKETFMNVQPVRDINTKINSNTHLTDKEITISVDLATQNAWEASLMTYLNNIPFHYIGKGEQSITKTALALSHHKSQEANIILIEEPENHLSHSKLNELLNRIISGITDKQIIVSTHSSYVANKLGIENLILVNNRRTTKLNQLSPETQDFFKKLPGYNVLRLILCKKAILVEGDSDELIIQRVYKDLKGKIPIEDGIDVISVGTAFLRFLEISEKLNQNTIVITDNDGSISNLKKKYSNYIDTNKKDNITILYDVIEHPYNGLLEKYNNNTLEPCLLRANSITILNTIFNTSFTTEDEMLHYMKNNKTKCALSIFSSTEAISYPQYIIDAMA